MKPEEKLGKFLFGQSLSRNALRGVTGSRPTRSEDGRAERKDSGNEKNQEDQRLPDREVQRPGKAGQ